MIDELRLPALPAQETRCSPNACLAGRTYIAGAQTHIPATILLAQFDGLSLTNAALLLCPTVITSDQYYIFQGCPSAAAALDDLSAAARRPSALLGCPSFPIAIPITAAPLSLTMGSTVQVTFLSVDGVHHGLPGANSPCFKIFGHLNRYKAETSTTDNIASTHFRA